MHLGPGVWLRIKRCIGALLVVAAMVACHGTTDTPLDAASRFTTEIAVPLVRTAEWRLTPRFRIDADSADLTVIAQAVPNARGGLALIQRNDGTIVLISPDGRTVNKVGFVGDGPGEFRFLAQLGWQGDTLWATDIAHRRLSYFDSDGTLLTESRWGVVDSVILPQATTGISLVGSSGSFPWGVRRDGAVVFVVADKRVLGLLHPPAGRAMMSARPSGASARAIATLPLPSSEDVSRYQMAHGNGAIPVPFRGHPDFAIDPISERVAVFDSVVVADSGTASARVTVIRTTGDTVYQATIPFTTTPIGAVVRDSVEAAYREREWLKRPGLDRARVVRELIALIPPTYAPVADHFIAIDGRVWLGMPTGPWGQRWLVLAAEDGRPIGEVLAPPTVTLIGAAGGWAWGLDGIASELQSPVMFTLTDTAATATEPPEIP